MADPFAKMKSGDVFEPTAEMVNGWNDAARALQAGRLNQGGRPISGALLPGQVLIENNSGDDRDIHDVLAIDGLVIEPNGEPDDFVPFQAPVLKGIAPSAGWEKFGKFVVLAEPIANEGIGRAWISGTFWARVKGKGSYADIVGLATAWLRAAPFGYAHILVDPTGGDGERLVVVRMADPQLQCIAKANGLIEAGGSGTFTVLSEIDEEETDIIITAGNPSGPTVEPTKRYELKWINQAWEVGDGPCGDE